MLIPLFYSSYDRATYQYKTVVAADAADAEESKWEDCVFVVREKFGPNLKLLTSARHLVRRSITWPNLKLSFDGTHMVRGNL